MQAALVDKTMYVERGVRVKTQKYFKVTFFSTIHLFIYILLFSELSYFKILAEVIGMSSWFPEFHLCFLKINIAIKKILDQHTEEVILLFLCALVSLIVKPFHALSELFCNLKIMEPHDHCHCVHASSHCVCIY